MRWPIEEKVERVIILKPINLVKIKAKAKYVSTEKEQTDSK